MSELESQTDHERWGNLNARVGEIEKKIDRFERIVVMAAAAIVVSVFVSPRVGGGTDTRDAALVAIVERLAAMEATP